MQRRRDRNTPRVSLARRQQIRHSTVSVLASDIIDLPPVTGGDIVLLLDEIERLEDKLAVGPEPVIKRRVKTQALTLTVRAAAIKAQGAIIDYLKGQVDTLKSATLHANRIAEQTLSRQTKLEGAVQKHIEAYNVIREAFETGQADLTEAVQIAARQEVLAERNENALDVLAAKLAMADARLAEALKPGDHIAFVDSYLLFCTEQFARDAAGDTQRRVRVKRLHRDLTADKAVVIEMESVPAPAVVGDDHAVSGPDDALMQRILARPRAIGGRYGASGGTDAEAREARALGATHGPR